MAVGASEGRLDGPYGMQVDVPLDEDARSLSTNPVSGRLRSEG
jgi:hypothetical protein